MTIELREQNARDIRPGADFRESARHKWTKCSSRAVLSGYRISNGQAKGQEVTKVVINNCLVFDPYQKLETRREK